MSDDQTDQLWLIPRQGEARRQLVADVVVAVRSRRVYTYGVPEPLVDRVRCGSIVYVPFGRGGRVVEGVCVAAAEKPWDHTRKAIQAVSPVEPLLTDRLAELGLWLADYYWCSYDQAFAAMTPLKARQAKLRRVKHVEPIAGADRSQLTPKQCALLDAVGEGAPRAEVLERAGVGPGVLQTLCKRGAARVVEREELVAPAVTWPEEVLAARGRVETDEDAFELTAGQDAAVEAIRGAVAERQFRTFLLFGVPGSGKTEVYVRAIRDVVAQGRQAVMIVPEIALATQLVDRLARRFDRVAVLHSQLSDRRRVGALRAIAAGAVDVVIGTRTAVFAPCRNLGLIVVDEEQEGSLKNLGAPFFHARDVAVKRAQIEGVPAVLGSATPSMETWRNANESSHYGLLRLPERAPGAVLPRTRAVVTDSGRAGTQTSPLVSTELMAELRATLEMGQQAILLHNRRGYSFYLKCGRCGLTVRCPRCDSSMALHRERPNGDGGGAGTFLKCHRCGVRQAPAPTTCRDGSCGGRLERAGLAIQQLEDEVRRQAPEARVVRLDSDTMRRREDYEEALRRFEAREADVMLGTQMVAKGLDFPAVRLVGVVDADAALWLPDLRAGERAFQLLMQVVGRAGRKEGESLAIVQAADVEAPAIREALKMDYERFAEIELASRRRLFYPPYSRLARLVLADSRPGRARDEAKALSGALGKVAERVHPHLRVDGAEPCVIPRLREMLRQEIIVRGPRDGAVQQLLHAAESEKLLRPRVQRFTIDVDAIDLL